MSPRRYILAALLSVLCLAAPAQSRRDIAALDSLVAVSDSAAARGLVLRKATLLKRMYCFDEAAEALSSLLRPGSMDTEVLGELADCHYQAGRSPEAMLLYMQLTQLHPEDLGNQVRFLSLLNRAGALSDVVARGREVLQRDTLIPVLTLVGDAFNKMEQPDSAMHYYGAALHRRPRNASVVSKMSNILLERKDYDGALSLAENYLALDSLNIDILRIQGLAYYLKENWMLSADAFELAVELGDDTYAPHYYLAKDYSGLHMFREADEHFMRAWQLDSTRASLALEIAVNRTNGIAAYRTGVVPWFEKALKMMEPDSTLMSSIYQNYATAEYTRMDWDKAISLYQKAYEYNQKNISALSTIGYCYEQKKDYRHAVEYYERYLKVGRPGTRAYQFVEESLRFVRAERFMEDP
ncbi:MAG: tetratricopeptide repeat protein [Bacteroidales bacterium]|nr:tetratricopeptide repeat protein [Bacteroidales bacterium]